MKIFLLTLILLSTQAFGNDAAISKVISTEWSQFRALVETLEADGDIGGYMEYKEFGEMTLLWRVSNDPQDNETIRFFMRRADGTPFTVTYHKSDIIMNNKIVIRRFIGPEPTGWINHTIDFVTGEYLGQQGNYPTTVFPNEQQMMNEWNITPVK